MRFKVSYDADHEGRAILVFGMVRATFYFHRPERLKRRIVSAEDGVRFEMLQVFFESRPRVAWEQPFDAVEPPRQFGVVRLFEHHSPEFRRAFNQLHITIRNHLSMKRRKEFHQIDSLDGVLRMFCPPRFLQSRRGSDVASSGGYRCNQYAHSVPDMP